MKNILPPLRLSQVLAAATVMLLLSVMLAPLRMNGVRGVDAVEARAIPLLTMHAAADGASFHRREYRQPIAADDVSRLRSPVVERQRLELRRELRVIKRTTPLEVNFSAPRTAWQHLDANARAGLDAQLREGAVTTVELRRSGSAVGGMDRLRRMERWLRADAEEAQAAVVLGNGSETADGAVEVAGAGVSDGVLRVLLVGDFFETGPSAAQLEALDEVLDYLAVRGGRPQVRLHGAVDASPASADRALGPMFPGRLLLEALNPARAGP
ncbi:MAG: hypothetical protein KDK99_16005 [Verrucomicrobiales bacterium]|nr:hypothetical protein [Verrucomicrobiales bacterium]